MSGSMLSTIVSCIFRHLMQNYCTRVQKYDKLYLVCQICLLAQPVCRPSEFRQTEITIYQMHTEISSHDSYCEIGESMEFFPIKSVKAIFGKIC